MCWRFTLTTSLLWIVRQRWTRRRRRPLTLRGLPLSRSSLAEWWDSLVFIPGFHFWNIFHVVHQMTSGWVLKYLLEGCLNIRVLCYSLYEDQEHLVTDAYVEQLLLINPMPALVAFYFEKCVLTEEVNTFVEMKILFKIKIVEDCWSHAWMISEFLPPRPSTPKSSIPRHPLWVSNAEHPPTLFEKKLSKYLVKCSLLNCSFKGGVSTGKVVLQLSLTFVGTTLPSMSPLFWTGLLPFSFVYLFILIFHILISSYSCILDPHQNKIFSFIDHS